MTPPGLRQLLAEAPGHLPVYLERTAHLSHASKGIRRSELFFFFAAIAAEPPRRILESGRARAQSTLVLSLLFPHSNIISIESDAQSPDVAIAEERLRDRDNVESRFGDSRLLLPEMVESGDVVLIDGPKDFRAVRLALQLLQSGKPRAVFVHDLWLGSPARPFVDRRLPEVFLSDAPEWVAQYARLDHSRFRPPAPARSGRIAYGATLGCFPPMENYPRRLRECALARTRERVANLARKLRRAPAPRRPKDFAAVGD